MRIGFLINEFVTLKPTQTTAMMIHECARLGHETLVFGVGELGIRPDGYTVANARLANPSAESVQEQVAHVCSTHSTAVELDELDAILIRTNPARDERRWAHEGALQLLAGVRDRGTPVINDPDGLRNTGSKVFLCELPEWTRPRTAVSANSAALIHFVRDAPGPTVLKPATGTRGADVFKLRPDSENLNAIVDVLLRQGLVIAQDFVPEAIHGDTRVVVLDGDVLAINGNDLAIERIPAQSEFRSNIHLGGRAAPRTVTPGMRKVVSSVGPILMEHGIRLAGLDFLGDVLCEVNVYSTGGFRAAELFSGLAFVRYTLSILLGNPTHV